MKILVAILILTFILPAQEVVTARRRASAGGGSPVWDTTALHNCSATGNGVPTLTCNVVTTGANSLVVIGLEQYTISTASATVDGNATTLVTASQPFYSSGYQFVWYIPGLSAGTHVVLVNTNSASFSGINVGAITGANATTPIDGVNKDALTTPPSSPGSSPYTCPAATTTATGDLIVTYATVQGQIPGAGSGFTLQVNGNNGAWESGNSPTGAPGSYGSTFTFSGSAYVACVVFGVKS